MNSLCLCDSVTLWLFETCRWLFEFYMIEFFQSQFGFSLVLIGALLGVIMLSVAYCILLERKISAWVQDRIGPNRAGPFGLLQPIADGVKFFLKEDGIPANVDKPIFILAPAISFALAIINIAVIPWAGVVDLGGAEPVRVQVASVDVGLLYILAVGSLGVYGIILGGWASNNKYSFIGGIRTSAQMLSYEIPMGLAILTIVLVSGELRLENIVAAQMGDAGGAWNVLLHPVAFLLFLITSLAEAHRIPFDLAEAEQELVTGYVTEYSSMKMALFYLTEYFHMIVGGAILAVLFFGGWELFPFASRLDWAWLQWLHHDPTWPAALCRFGVMAVKIAGYVFVLMLIRWTLPRFRFDQLMRMAWEGLIPFGLALLVLAVTLVYLGRPVSIWAPIGNAVIVAAALVYFSMINRSITGRQAYLPPTQNEQPPVGPRAGWIQEP